MTKAPMGVNPPTILIDGIGRSGTSLLGRLMSIILAPRGYTYYYEPFKHPSPAGDLPNWPLMTARVLLPTDNDAELSDYLQKMERSSAAPLLWKEIRLALKQDWLLLHFPEMLVIHITRDVLGVLSSHRREDAPEWMAGHRRIWLESFRAWLAEPGKLCEKGIASPPSLESLSIMSDLEIYAAHWAMNESFVKKLASPRLHCICYEHLCADPEHVLDSAAQFVGASIDSATRSLLTKEMADSESERDPSGAGTGLPPRDMPEIWKGRLTEAEIAGILRVAGDARSKLGYPPVEIPARSHTE